MASVVVILNQVDDRHRITKRAKGRLENVKVEFGVQAAACVLVEMINGSTREDTISGELTGLPAYRSAGSTP